MFYDIYRLTTYKEYICDNLNECKYSINNG